jgi:N-methylhydantoinase B
MSSGISNTMNTPIEILEMSFPVRVERYAVIPDSGGVGKYRGGCGVERVWRILGNPAQVSVCLERGVTPPFGLAGGGPGAGARVSVVAPDGAERRLNTKGTFTAEPDSQVVMHAPGAGGYGPPSERNPARAQEDRRNGYVEGETSCPACESGRHS